MGMIRCPKCDSAISDRVSKCPHCGNPVESRPNRYSQFYEKPRPQAYQPEPQYVEVREERARPQRSSKGLGLSILAIAVSLMGLLMSFLAIVIASSRPKEVYVEKEVPVYNEVETEDYPKETEPEIEEKEQEKKDSNRKKFDYSASEPIFYTYTNSIGNIEYCFIQEIRNTGDRSIYLKGCNIDIEDESGHLIATEDFISNCPDVIRPGEIGYFYNSLGATILNEAAKSANSLRCVPSVNIVESTDEPIEYEVSDTSLTKGNFNYPTVTGRVTNNTNEDDSLLYLNVIFYDVDGNVIAITGVNVQDLTAGSTKGFECTSLTSGKISYEDIGDYKVVARKAHYQF